MASSSSSYKYEVFLSFRGEDTRESFTSHLYASLCRKKIKTFIDEELRRGDEISPTLLEAIEVSKIYVIIFSKDYASSKWCLNELVKILECKKRNGQIVIPVFYHIHPSDVRKQSGSFVKAFVKYENDLKEMPGMVQKWRAALKEASYLSGHESVKIRPEAKLVEVIVEDILEKLGNMTLSTKLFEGLIGLDSRVDQVKSLLGIGLSDCRILGIWGMGGIGKTTLAEALFKQISNKFEGKCFMGNVREKLQKRYVLEDLQKQILSKLLEEDLDMGGINIRQYTQERLQRMKVFIVLDDVNEVKQLEYIIGQLSGFGPGSRIIITTTDRQVLDEYRIDKIFELTGLDYDQAVKLFCKYAFHQNYPTQGLMSLLWEVVNYAKGNPLALKVLGSFFHQKGKQEWENALDNLKRITNYHIHDVLKISYDELKWDEKSIFLDIACFFKGERRDHVVKVLSDDHSSMHYGINVLFNKSLITILDNRLEMHDILQELGHEIVRQESIKEPGKRSRLWNPEDVYHVLKKNKGTNLIEGLFLDMSKVRDLHLTSEAFGKMSNLRLLKFYIPYYNGNLNISSKVHLPQGLDYLSDDLRYLHWHGYPLKALPSNFSPENLIELNLPYSKVEQLWEGEKEAFKLEYMDLYHSQYLTQIPRSKEIPIIKEINLSNCTKLPSISPSIQDFNYLSKLSLNGCESLRCFPSSVFFRSAIKIDFSNCINLKEFPRISGKVIELRLWKTAIEEVPSYIKSLTNLELLDLSSCARLKRVSTSICKLKSLRNLKLRYCSSLEKFPQVMENTECLEDVGLELTAINELPFSIKRSTTKLNEIESLYLHGYRGYVLPPLLGLAPLVELCLNDCGMREIPEDFGCLSSLKSLYLRGNNFESLPASIKQLSKLYFLDLSNCNMLRSIPELPISLWFLDAANCKRLQSLPELPSYQEELNAAILQTLSTNAISPFGARSTFANCQKLKEQANNILADSQLRIQHMIISSLRLIYAKIFNLLPSRINMCLPGSGIPEWFRNQCSGSSITIQLPQDACNRKFIGFALSAVIDLEKDSDACDKQLWVACLLRETNFWHDFIEDGVTIFDQRHVLLGFAFRQNAWLHFLDGDHCKALSFEFLGLSSGGKAVKVKCCGVCPVYVHPNETIPNTLTLKFEEECIEIGNLDNDFVDKVGTSGTGEWKVEPSPKRICREDINSP